MRPPQQEEAEQEVDEVESLEQEGISLRWTGHRLHGANIGLRQRHENAMGNLEGRSDGEAKAVLLRLAKESREMNGELAAHLLRMSMLNLGVVEMLKKSRDGRAALMMRSAAEILVKVRSGPPCLTVTLSPTLVSWLCVSCAFVELFFRSDGYLFSLVVCSGTVRVIVFVVCRTKRSIRTTWGSLKGHSYYCYVRIVFFSAKKE